MQEKLPSLWDVPDGLCLRIITPRSALLRKKGIVYHKVESSNSRNATALCTQSPSGKSQNSTVISYRFICIV